MKPIRFTKMQGIGNDFMVIDALSQSIQLSSDQISHLADRQLGVGFDQLLVVEPPTDPEADFFYRIYNADGSTSGQCGNGARCFAKFVFDKRLSPKRSLMLQTESGHMRTQRLDSGRFLVELSSPQFEPELIPFSPSESSQDHTWTFLASPDDAPLSFGVCNVGNPHAVVLLDHDAPADLEPLASALKRTHTFPQDVNVGFMRIVTDQEIELRVFERGVGETLGCGSGACAAVAVGRQWQKLASEVKVSMPGGDLVVAWPGGHQSLSMTGSAARVFEGTIQLDA